MLRIIIADDHMVVRKGLKQLVLDEFVSAEIAEAEDAEQLIKLLLNNSEWDLVVCDVNMPGRSGIDVIPQIHDINPKLPVLILSYFPEELYAIRALKAGAAGYLNKVMAPDELISAIRRVLLGKKFISASLAEKLASMMNDPTDGPSHEHLSDREFEVMKLLADGQSVTDIAERLSISVTTVSTYRSRVLLKMGMKSNADLTRYAMENKLI